MERIGAGRNHGGRYPTRENYEPNPNQRRHSPVQVGDDRTYPIDSICQIGLLVTFLPAPLHAQSRTILNLWTAPQTRPSRHQTLPGSGPRHGRRTDREQHIADKIRSVEEKLR